MDRERLFFFFLMGKNNRKVSLNILTVFFHCFFVNNSEVYFIYISKFMVTLSYLRDGLRGKISMGGSKVGYIISDKGEFKGSFQGFKLGPSLLPFFFFF